MFGKILTSFVPRLPSLGFFRDALTERSGEFDIARIAFFTVLISYCLIVLTFLSLVWYCALKLNQAVTPQDFANASAVLLAAFGGSVLAAAAGVGIRAHFEDNKGGKNEGSGNTGVVVNVEAAAPAPQAPEGQQEGPSRG